MIDIYLFSKNRKVLSFFKIIRNSKTFSLVIYNPVNYKTILRTTTQTTFVYVDVSSFEDSERKKLINYITRQKRFDFGIIDPKNSISDPAELFYHGASDYMGKDVLKHEAKVKRIKNAIDYYSIESVEDELSAIPVFEDMPTMLSGHNWDNIKVGNEYTFCMLHIEIDILQEWASKSGKAHIEEVMEFFYSHIDKIITPINGRMWMKTDFGGLVLFPYDGSCTSIIIECIKLVMNRIIFSAEEYTYSTILSYRMSLDIGNTKYLTSGNTGNIISDSVNFIFHFGKQYALPGNFYLTGRVHEDIPPGLMDKFCPSERFEDRTIYRMKLPVFK
ncbi:MAG: hypothetical protein KAR21_18785 [Spirochaetales bacterium]|nr:hypothetical protein [Spirochaetales bacterium]